MSKFQPAKTRDEKEKLYLFFCPGCETYHYVRTEGQQPTWSLSGLENDKPTVKPSIRVRYGNNEVCHLFITDGKIQFLNDCTHKLAGKTVTIPDFDDKEKYI